MRGEEFQKNRREELRACSKKTLGRVEPKWLASLTVSNSSRPEPEYSAARLMRRPLWLPYQFRWRALLVFHPPFQLVSVPSH
ncbi:MAG: hypothetical protein DMG06_18500 [Acidobacteria bacterium]|nr:MAG: hypothetical protein DMG06_18500 [Acidobacteriota bacterium]